MAEDNTKAARRGGRQGDSRFARLLRWEAGETPGPWEMILFPTNRCNQRCEICWQRWVEVEYGNPAYVKEVSDERLRRLVDEAAELGVQEWSIVGGGDPMVRSKIVMELCERIVGHGMSGVLHSNGTLFKREHFEHLLRIGWPKIAVSLDGPDAEVNDTIRTRGSFDKATGNLRMLADMKRECGVDAPRVGICSVITRTNFDRLDDMVRMAHDLQTALGFSMLLVHDDHTYPFVLTDEQQARLPERLHEIATLAAEFGVECNAASLLPENQPNAMAASDMAGDGRLADSLCFEAWLSMAIIADGKTGPCCVFYDEEAALIHDKTLQEVWLGPQFRELRNRLRARRNVPNYCQNCASHNIARTADLRRSLQALNETRWNEMPTHRRVAFITRRAATSLRSSGLRKTIRRAQEWANLHLR
ncbi:MAG: radical SAM protein [Nitrospiraceae bacterium]|nr:radical SAM protein [Nitrospiraceae bacterium]